MDTITYNGEWYREPLGSYATGPPYVREWNREVKVLSSTPHNLHAFSTLPCHLYLPIVLANFPVFALFFC